MGRLISLFGDFFRDFWPGFLASDRRTVGGLGGGGGVGEKFIRNTALQYYRDEEIHHYSTTYYSLFNP